MVLTGSLILGVLAGAIILARSPQLLSFAPLAQSTVQARSMPAADFRDANLRELGGSATLVKAVMPEERFRAPHTSKHAPVTAPKRNLRQYHALPHQPEWVVLTEWGDNEPPPHLVIAVVQENRSSYAAVAIANGWLIVQI